MEFVAGYRVEMQKFAVVKDENKEHPIPWEWRPMLTQIANAFVSGNEPIGTSIRPTDIETLQINLENLSCYPDPIGPLSENSWNSSVYIWMVDYWQLLVDLSEIDGSTSDLVLHVRVYEIDNKFEFEPGLIYVP